MLRHGRGLLQASPIPLPADDDDRALVEAALGDPRAYARIVRRYESQLSRYVGRLLGRYRQSAEDILQETFIKAYLNLNDYDRARPFAPWLYRIAHNEAVSFLRKRGSQPQHVEGEDGLRLIELITDTSDPYERLGLARLETSIHAALAALGGKYQDVLVLRYLEDRSYDDIADILALPMGTVATRIRRGLAQLKQALAASGAAIAWRDDHE